MFGNSKKDKCIDDEAAVLNTATVHTNNVIVEMKGKFLNNL